MPKLKNHEPGARHNFWLREHNFKIYKEIENKSEFINIALEAAIDIMTWDILKKMDPKVYKTTPVMPEKDIIDQFNKKHPLDDLTAKRLGKTPSGTEPISRIESDSTETNPAL